jgi:hypothetical protein
MISVFRFRFFGFDRFRCFDVSVFRSVSIDRSGARATLETSFFVELELVWMFARSVRIHSPTRRISLCVGYVRACVDINLDGTNKERYGANRTGADDGIDGRKERIRPTAGDEKKEEGREFGWWFD